MAKNPPINYMSQDYIPTLNSPQRRPATSNGGCFRNLLISVVILVSIAGLIWYGISGFIPQATSQATPTENRIVEALALTMTNTARPTLDAWSATGTALVFATASPTVDFCGWLTPTATHTPTLPYTPDSWQREGTAIYEATNPPITPTAQPTTPRSWCDFHTATFTPLALQRDVTVIALAATSTPSLTPTMIITIKSISPGGGGGGWIAPTEAPILIPPTDAPPVILPTIARTKKPKKTRTPTPTLTLTPTLTITATEMPSVTPTLTPTATESPTSTSTLMPPVIVLYSADCNAGYPMFLVQNTGGSGDIFWAIVIRHDDADLVAASGMWGDELNNGAIAPAAALTWAGIEGEYRLYVESQPVAVVECVAMATVTPSATFAPEETLEPTLEPTITETVEEQA